MKFIITGITSFLGLNTAKALLLDGHNVLGLLRPDSPSLDKLTDLLAQGLSIAYIDLHPGKFSLSQIDDLFPESGAYDVWIHYAWEGPGSILRADPSIQARNIAMAKSAFTIASQIGCKKFLFAGSQAEYGKGSKTNPDPVSEYGKAKLAFCRWAFAQSDILASMQYVHMRIYSVYGQGDHSTSLIYTLINSIDSGKEVELSPCEQQWTYLEIRDCVAAVELLATSSLPSSAAVFDIAGERLQPLKDFVNTICTISNNRIHVRFGIRPSNAEGPTDMDPDLSPIKALGFREKISFEKGILSLIKGTQ